MDTPLQWWRRHGWRGRLLVILIALYLLWVLLVFLVLPGWLRGKGETLLSERLGRTVTIERLALNPLTLSATVENFKIADADTGTLLGFKRLYVNTEFWASLFHWRPWIGRVELDGLDTRLRRAPDGTLNVEDVIARLGESEPPPEPPPDEAEQSKGPPALTVAYLSLSNGEISVTDAVGEEPVNLKLPVAFTVEDLTTLAPEQGDNRYVLHIEGPDGGTLDWDGRFSLAPLTTEGHLKMDGVDLVSFARLLAPQIRFRVPSGELGLGMDYRFSAAPGAGLQLENGRFSLRRLSIVPQGSEQPTLELPELSVSGLAMDTAKRQVSIPQVTLSGPALRVVRNPEGVDIATLFLPRDPLKAEQTKQRVEEQADDTAEAIKSGDQQNWTVTLDQLEVEQGAVTLSDQTLAKPAELRLGDGALQLTDLSVGDEIAWHWSGSGTLAGQGRLEHSGEGHYAPLNVDARVKLEGLPLDALAPWVEDAAPVVLKQGSAHADLAINVAGEAPAVRVSGSAGVDQVAVLERGAQAPFVSVGSLKASGLDVRTDQHSVALAGLDISGLQLDHDINKNGQELISRLSAGGAENSSGSGPEWRVRLNKTTVKDSRLAHHDESQSPPFQVSLEKWSGSLANFDTAGDAAKVNLEGRVNGNAPLKASGSIDPDPLLVDLTVSLKGYGMDGLTPYTGRYLGYAVNRGVLTVETKVKIENQTLSSDTSFAADRFFLGDTVASDDAISVPVKLGLAVLRDASGMIQLPLDVSGDMSDPSFSVAGVVFRVIRNVLVKAATAPFSLLAGLVGGEDLEHIAFGPGEATPSAEVEQSLTALAKMLGERPELSVEISGQTDQQDRQALAEAELVEALGGDWPGLDEAVADDGFFGLQRKIIKQFEKRFDQDADTLGVEGDGEQADQERARLAWTRMLEKASAGIGNAALQQLAAQRAGNARDDLVSKQGIDAARVQLAEPKVDGDVGGVKLGLGKN
tara:strand:- start:7073 stop:9991 length:2919 start_codon:yes stop_codon:yes gene_type:complete